ncbi:MAG: signal peptidase I [Clostridiaceae bacterium]|nr:signal peptidase I [Clostridiaceae bacterium]
MANKRTSKRFKRNADLSLARGEKSAVEQQFPPRGKYSAVYEILDWLRYTLIAVVIALLVTVFVFQRNQVVGSSMLPTLMNNDQLLVEKVTAYFGIVRRGTIVTLDGSDLDGVDAHVKNSGLVKRIIALPGDELEFKDGVVYLNGERLKEPYLPPGTKTFGRGAKGQFKMTIPDNHCFVMGDNRQNSMDSRDFGPVEVKSIVGEVLFRIYPFNRIGIP